MAHLYVETKEEVTVTVHTNYIEYTLKHAKSHFRKMFLT